MRIPSGDLAPARKHRRYGRRRNPLPIVLAVVLVLAIAGVAYALHRQDKGAGTLTARARCGASTPAPQPSRAAVAPTAVAPVRLPAAGQVQLRLLNGSSRDLLARSVGNELARRGFRVSAMGNAPRPLAGASRVYYGPGARASALLISAHVLGASVQPVGTAARGAVDVVLGSTFVRLRTAAEASAYAHAIATGIPTGTAPIAKPAAPMPAASSTCR